MDGKTLGSEMILMIIDFMKDIGILFKNVLINMNLENINVVNMKKIIITLIVSFLFTQAHAFKTCKELGVGNEQGLGLDFAILQGVSYIKGFSDAKKLDIEFGSELNDSFTEYLKNECKKKKNHYLFEITKKFILMNYLQKTKILNTDKLITVDNFLLRLVGDSDQKLRECFIKVFDDNIINSILKNYNKLEDIRIQRELKKISENLIESVFDENDMELLISNISRGKEICL